MSLSIISRTVASVTEKRLSILNQALGRKFSWGSTWNDIRVNWRCAFNCNETGFAGGTLFIGLGAGTNSLYGETTTANAIGQKVAPGTWGITGTAGTAGRSVYANTTDNIIKKVGATETTFSQSDYSYMTISATPDLAVYGAMLRFLRISASQISVQKAGYYENAAKVNHTRANFLLASDCSDLASAAGVLGINVGYARTVTSLDEVANGAFDSLHIYWSHSSIPLEISDIIVTRVS